MEVFKGLECFNGIEPLRCNRYIVLSGEIRSGASGVGMYILWLGNIIGAGKPMTAEF